ncbi:MAG TPA: gamma-glutamyltransferase [Bacteroidales bacterium]|nr:gamma-glutamyltransferase [Bacteroidales bacterium]
MRVIKILTLIILISGCKNRSANSANEFIEGKDIISTHGMVVSSHPEASRTGIAVLKKGGNAVDAAVAVEFALAVCYPEAGNLGGGGFMIVSKSDVSKDVIDYREKAPVAAKRNMFLDNNENIIEGLSTETHLAAGVPGTVDGMIRIHDRYGELDFREVIQPAVDLAEKGFPLPEGQAASLNRNRENFIKRNSVRPAFVRDSLWKAEDILRQPDLAETLKRIRDFGRAGFYSGKTAELIIREMKRGDGIITKTDLENYTALFREPLQAEYKGYNITTVPPPSGGGITLIQLLGMVESSPLGNWGFHSARTVHFIAEAERRAFADRSEYSGDADFVYVPVKELTDKEYLKKRMSDFNSNRASLSSVIRAGKPAGYESEQTTHYSVADKSGNAVAATTTLNNTFGSSIVVEGAGFILNNEMDDFSVRPGVPNMYGLTGGDANAIEPGKRMLSSMTPVIVEKGGKLFLVAGTPGGSTIPTTVFQVLINVLDYNMKVSEAVNTGRFHHQWLPDWISIEANSIDSMTLIQLKNMGHEYRVRASIGSVNAIQILQDGKLAGGADIRGYNSACGY